MRTKFFLCTVSLFFFMLNISSQVTIGSKYEPVKGALLDLKEQDNSDTKEGKANSTKGLLLPRVKLTTLNNLSDIPASVGETAAGYQGLMVYNVGESPDFCDPNRVLKGLYVWDGLKWTALVKETKDYGVKELFDARDNNKYLYRSFGNAGEWMVENLRFVDANFGFSQAGDTENNLQRIFYPQTAGGTETNPANISTWDNSHGVLYSYSAATYGIRDVEDRDLGNQAELDASIIGVCPKGWHIPTDYEWSRLEEEIAQHPTAYSITSEAMPWNESYNSSMGDRPADVVNAHGAAMKYMCLLPETSSNTGGTGFAYDEGGLGALLIGSASTGSAKSYTSTAVFMSGSTYNANKIYGRLMYNDKSKVGRVDVDRKELMSVRCKKIVRPSLIDINQVVRIRDQTIYITTNPLDLKGISVRWISPPSHFKPDANDMRKGKLGARVPGKFHLSYELTTEDGEVLVGVFEVVVVS